MIETVQLKVISPKVSLPGLEDAVRMLKQLDERLDILSKRPGIVIKGFEGAAQSMRQMSDYAKLVTEAFDRLGEKDPAARMRQGFRTLGEELKYLEAEAGKLQASLAGAPRGAVRASSPAADKKASQLESALAAINLRRSEITGGLPSDLSTQLQFVREQEKGLAAAAGQSTTAMQAQGEVASQKAGVMGQLAGATEAVTVAERGATAAMGEHALLTEKFITTEKGLMAHESLFRTGIGETKRVMGEGSDVIVEQINYLEKMTAAFRDNSVEFARRRATVGKGSREEIALLREEAAEMQKIAQGFAQFGRTPAANRQELRGAALSRRANELEARLGGPARFGLFPGQPGNMSAEQLSQSASRLRQQEFERRAADFGGRTNTSVSAGAGGRTERTTTTRDVEGVRQVMTLTSQYDAQGRLLNATLAEQSRQFEGVGKSSGLAGRGILNTLQTVTAFYAAGRITLGVVEAIRYAFESYVKIERETAVLRSAFKGTEEDATELRDKTLELAAAYGRTSEEAVDATTRWARLGLTAKEALEATEVSLEAANVSEVKAGEAAERLGAIFIAYRLQVGELRTALNQLNAISLAYEITNEDLLKGVVQAAPIARQAGIGYVELAGIIAASTRRAGVSATSLATGVRQLITTVNQPNVQKILSQNFGVNVSKGGGDIKQMSEIINELYQKFVTLSQAEQQELIIRLGGARQASRITAILDSYITSQTLAIRALTQLNAADQENQRIRESLRSQLVTLNTEYQRLAVNLANAGSGVGASFNQTLIRSTEFLSNLIRVMGSFPNTTVIFIALLGVMAVRLALSASRMNDGAKSSNFLTNSLRQLRLAYGSLGEAVLFANGQLAKNAAITGQAATSATGAAAKKGVSAATGGGIVALGNAAAKAGEAAEVGLSLRAVGLFALESLPGVLKLVGVLLLIEGLMKGVNLVFEHFGSDTNKASKELQLYNEQLQKLKSNAEAAGLSSRLSSTLGKTLPSLAERNPQAARRALEDYSTITGSTHAEQQKTRDELVGLLQQGRVAEVQARLEKDSVKFAEQKRDLGRQSAQQNSTEIARLSQRLDMVNQEATKRREAGLETIVQSKEIAELEKQIADYRGEGVKNLQDATEEEEQIKQSAKEAADDRKKEIENRFKGVEDVAGAYPKTENKADELNRQIDLLNAKADAAGRVADERRKSAGDRREQILRETQPALDKFGPSDSEKYQGLVEAAARAHAEAQQIGEDSGVRIRNLRSSFEPGAGAAVGRGVAEETLKIAAAKERARLADEELKKFTAEHGKEIEAGEEALKLRRDAAEEQSRSYANIQHENEEQQKAIQAEKEKLEALRAYAELQEAVIQGARQGRIETEQFKIGRNETEQLFSEARGIGFAGVDADAQRRIDEQQKEVERRAAIVADDRSGRLIDSERERARTDSRFNPGGPSYTKDGKIVSAGSFNLFGELEGRGKAQHEKELRDAQTELQNRQNIVDRQQAGHLLNQLRGKFEDAKGRGDVTGQAAAQSEALELGNRLTSIQLSLDERRYKLAADIVNERRKETEEASKALQTASREEQLRAALVAKFVQNRGGRGFSANEFQFLERGTQEAITKFNPNASPSTLPTRSRELEQELANLTRNFAGVSAGIKETVAEIEKTFGRNLITNPNAPNQATVPGNIQLPPVNMQFNDQFRQSLDLLRDVIGARLDGELASMRAEFGAYLSTQRINAAQSGATAAI